VYRVNVFAASLFEAAMEVHKYCHDPESAHMDSPRLEPDDVIEVKPIYRVRMQRAMRKTIERDVGLLKVVRNR
jgi:hypothetical protein